MDMKNQNPLIACAHCGTDVQSTTEYGDYADIQCPVCGDYRLSGTQQKLIEIRLERGDTPPIGHFRTTVNCTRVPRIVTKSLSYCRADIVANLSFPLDASTRYHSGLDRWDRDALSGRGVLCSVSNCMAHAMDMHGDIWWWYEPEQLWYRMDPFLEPLIRAESDCFVAQMRKTLPLIRIFTESRFDGEREAAHAALCKLADMVNAMFRQSPHDGGATIKAMDLYSGLTREHRWQVPDLDPPEYDEAVEEALRQRNPFWIWLGSRDTDDGEPASWPPEAVED